VRAAGSSGKTALYYAAANGHVDTVAVLLSDGGWNPAQQGGLLALHVAAQRGHTEVLQVLLDYRANVAATTADGTTALHLAAKQGRTAAARVLVEAGADAQAADSAGSTALCLAAAKGHADTLSVLLSAVGLHKARDDGLFALHTAAKRGHLGEMQLLLDHGADVDAAATKPAQDFAAAEGKSSWAALAVPTALHLKGATALHVAALAGHRSAAQLLLRAGAKVDAADSLGRTALFCAALGGYADIAALLLSAAASVDKPTQNSGMLPLHAAAYLGRTETLQVLLDAGADVQATATETLTDCKDTAALHFAAHRGHAAAAQLLMDAGADVQAADSFGCTALHYAALHGQTDVVPVLLHAGATVDAVSATGETPLLCAVTKGHFAVVDLLLLAGADPNVADNNGTRPLQAAVVRHDVAMLLRLLQANADCNAPTEPLDVGESLLVVAAAFDSVAVVEALLAAGARSSIGGAFGHDALEAAVDLDEHAVPQVAMVVALLSRDHAAPSVAATRAALLSTMQTGLYDISARLLLHLHQAAQQQGINQDDAVLPVYAAQPVQDRDSDERARTSLALLHTWTADTAGTAATHTELAGQEQEVVAVTRGAQALMMQIAAARAAMRVAGPVRRFCKLQSLQRASDAARASVLQPAAATAPT
jgi:cytohesin